MMGSTWFEKLMKYYDEHLGASSTQASEAIGCLRSTAASARNKWKKMRGYKIGTKQHPVMGLVKIEQVEKSEQKEVAKTVTASASEIAAELLSKSVEAIRSYNQVLGERNFYRDQVNEAEAAREKAVIEKERILKIHNEVVAQVNRGKLPSIDDILFALRRDARPGQKL